MNFSHLPGLSRLECLKPGFESIPAGALLPLQVTEEVWHETGNRVAADGTKRQWTRTHRHYVIDLTGPDGIRHRFLTDAAEAALAPAIRHCPAGRGPTIKHHPITAFVEFFHVPVPDGTARPDPGDHRLLDLLEAIVSAKNMADSTS